MATEAKQKNGTKAPGPHTIHRCVVKAKDGTPAHFVSHHPDLFIEDAYPGAPGPEASAAIDAAMAGDGRKALPMKYGRRWLEELRESEWVESVTFTDDEETR